MYANYFQLKETPFSISPDPNYLYLGGRHKNALAHLFYGIRDEGGFILLTGEVGTGKTTLCRCLLEQIPEDVETAFILNPLLNSVELLAAICDEFGIDYPEDSGVKVLVDRLNAHLLKAHGEGKRCVLIVDEAQNLATDVLEQLRLLTNLETNRRKLLQIILLGQPELLTLLNREELRQLNQRITARYHLEALDLDDTREYIGHRLGVAGGDLSLFSRPAIRKVFRLSRGIPRVINLICDRALLGAYANTKTEISTAIVARAAREVLGGPPAGFKGRVPATLAALLVVGLAGYGYHRYVGPDAGATPEPATTTEPVRAEPPTHTPERDYDSLERVAGHEDIARAYHDLFALWGTAFEDKQTDPCRLAAGIGLGCYRTTASLGRLKGLDRPAIVGLNGGWLTVSALSDQVVTLVAGDRQFELSPEAFESGWQGNAHLLWRKPPAYSTPLKPDDQGETVDWLVNRLAIAAGNEPVPVAGQGYNQEVIKQVKDFQASVGLDPNGIVDILTWIHLNNLETTGIPVLTNPQSRG